MGIDHYDAVVVGGGMGGIYGVHQLREAGFSVLGLEGAPEFGGVWYHNCYPGARVDFASTDYSFLDPEIYREWRWSERYATQPELLRYLNFVADRYDVRRHFRLNTWLTGARWNPARALYEITTSTGLEVTARFLVMATGQLSHSKTPRFEGLDDFAGELYSTSHWPHHPVELTGKRVAVIGTGSSGVQAIVAVAKVAEHLLVVQRTPNWSVPAGHPDADPSYVQSRIEHVEEWKARLLMHPFGVDGLPPAGLAADFSPEEQQRLMAQRWDEYAPGVMGLFTDTGRSPETNQLVSDFVRSKIREMVDDPVVAEKLCPRYPIGTKRLIMATGYYETFNRDNVTLVDVGADPIVKFTEHGIQTESAQYDVDVIILALGFDAFTGALDSANIQNADGERHADLWSHGPNTFLGLMTAGLPNLFLLTGAGSPATLSNMCLMNTFHVDFVVDLMAHMRDHELAVVEPTKEAQAEWTQHCADVASQLLRLHVDNYMVRVNEDGSRVFMPYAGGLGAYVERCNEVIETGYNGFVMYTPSDVESQPTAALAGSSPLTTASQD